MQLEGPPPTQYGWGKGMLGVQDGGGAIMEAQLVDATVEDVAQHIRGATKCRHPAQTDMQGGDKEGDFKARVTRELRAAVEFSTGHEDMKKEFGAQEREQRRELRKHEQAVAFVHALVEQFAEGPELGGVIGGRAGRHEARVAADLAQA